MVDDSGGEGLVVYDTIDFTQRSTVRLDVIYSASFTSDSRFLAFGTLSKKVRLWSVNAMREIANFDAPESSQFGDRATISPDGRWMAADASVNALTIADLQAHRELFTLGRKSSPIKSVSWSRNGKIIALGYADGGVAIGDFSEVCRQLARIGLDWE